MTRHGKATVVLLLAAAGLAGCHKGENPFGIRKRSDVPYVVERPSYADDPGARPLWLSGYAGHNYGPPPVVAPIIRQEPTLVAPTTRAEP